MPYFSFYKLKFTSFFENKPSFLIYDSDRTIIFINMLNNGLDSQIENPQTRIDNLRTEKTSTRNKEY